jgi:hypothetical protein
VKTNGRPTNFWLLSKDFKEVVSPTHVYLFINLRGNQRPDYYVVPSKIVAKTGTITPPGKTIFYAFWREDGEKYQEKWSLFGAGN